MTTLAALALAPAAHAVVHWPGYGGGPGRSGSQELAAGQMPMTATYGVTGVGAVRTSPITTGGALNQQMLAFGAVNADGEPRLFLRNLVKGEAIGAAEGIDFGAVDADAFGDPVPDAAGQVGSVTPVDSSTTAQGQLYVVFNQDDLDADEPLAIGGTAPSLNDIGIAHIDPSNGTDPVASSLAVGLPYVAASGFQSQVTDGFTVNASPVLGPPEADGSRALVFVAQGPDGAARLFKVTIENASTSGAEVDVAHPEVVAVDGANAYASPAIAYLEDPVKGGIVPYVLVAGGGSGPAVRTFKLADLTAGPQSPSAGGMAGTPAVPADPTGLMPGQPGATLPRSPAVFVGIAKGSKTIVHRYEQGTNKGILSLAAASPADALNGAPGPALAVSQPYDAGAGRLAGGRVAVPTARNLYLLDADTLALADALRDAGESALNDSTGFSRTAPVVSGDFVYAMRNDGGQAVLRLSDGEPVCGGADVGTVPGCAAVEFGEAVENNGSTTAVGQPAVSNGYVQFASDKGVFVYRNSTQLRIVSPAAGSLVSRTVPVAATVGVGRDVSAVTFMLDGVAFATTDQPDGSGTFSSNLNTTALPDGVHTFGASAYDDAGALVDSDQRTIHVDNLPDPTAAFAYSPVPALTGEVIRFDAAESHTNPAGGGLVYRWDLDGNGTFETDGGYKPRTSKVYTVAGVYKVGLNVTDGNNQTATTHVDVVVSDPPPVPPNQLPVAAFTPSLNPAAPGETVSFDAGGSSDPDGPLQSFQWDLDGNGSFETDTGSSSVAKRRYDEAGLYKVGLRVVDAAGATAVKTVVLSVIRYDEKRKPIVSARASLSRAGVVSARGKLTLAGGARMVVPCDGVVTAVARVRGKRVGTGRTDVTGKCTFKLKTKLSPNRPRGRVLLQLRYLGSEALFPRAAAPIRLRAK